MSKTIHAKPPRNFGLDFAGTFDKNKIQKTQ